MVTTPDNLNGIPFDLLSTGLNNLFGWIGHLISRLFEAYSKMEDPMKGQAVVFVDEIDNYIHPQVQAKVIPVLLEHFQNVQFIFTTHSPIMLVSLPNHGAKAYRVENQDLVEIQHFYGRTVQDILFEDYGIEKRPVQEIQRKIDKMVRALNMDTTEAKKIYESLLPILGDKDPAILDAKYELNQN
jgi:predicted ATP-binding protein involved in virulence